uniref:Mono-ADP ribosylhydrolase 2 n=1 Tax=Sphaeramia orbicularis TaxID=375764 RepID=A0A673BP14_9TELE
IVVFISDNDKEEGKEVTGGGGLSDKVSLYKGDITVLEVDAIVNAGKDTAWGPHGFDGCIHKAAGSCLYDECHSLNGCETGKAKITCGYDLPARYVIHTVGPVARGHVGPTETNDLTSCYQNSLRLMKEHGLSTVAFPCISTGIYGFPNEPAADIALNTVKSWIEENPDKVRRVRVLCMFKRSSCQSGQLSICSGMVYDWTSTETQNTYSHASCIRQTSDPPASLDQPFSLWSACISN